MDQAIRDRLQRVISDNEIVLFMKGTPAMPQCGFSAQVVSILDSLGPRYTTVNVLEDPSVRQGIKELSDWPTIPQLYVKGEFVGGCDIVKEMFESGELEDKLGVQLEAVAPPQVTVTERAATAFKDTLQNEDEFVRLQVDSKFSHSLTIGPRQPKDVLVETAGLTLLLDRASAQRAEGATVDFVETPQGAAFKIDNPNEPPRVKPISALELKERLDSGDRLELFDVRTEAERQVARIEGARLLDKQAQQQIMSLPKDTMLVFLCHHGSRSQQAAEFFCSHGFSKVYNLEGGIDAWSETVDSTVPRY